VPVRVELFATERLARQLGGNPLAVESGDSDLASFARECAGGRRLVRLGSQSAGDGGYAFEVLETPLRSCDESEALVVVARCLRAFGHVMLERLPHQNEFWRSLVLLRTRLLRVRAVDPHGPVFGARVELHGRRGWRVGLLEGGDTGPAGAIDFAVRGGIYDNLRVSKPGYARVERWIEEGEVEIELALPHARTVSGVVTDEHGRPAARIRVAAIVDQSYPLRSVAVEAESGENGTFSLSNVAADVPCRVTGRDPTDVLIPVKRWWDREAQQGFVRIAMTTSGGLAVDLDGGGANYDLSVLRFALGECGDQRWVELHELRPTKTESGYLQRLEVRGLYPGRYRLREVNGFVRDTPEFEVVPGETTAIAVSLRPLRHVVGKILGVSMGPIDVTYPLEERNVREQIWLTPGGRFRLIPPPAAREVLLRMGGQDSARARLPLGEGDLDVGTLVMERE